MTREGWTEQEELAFRRLHLTFDVWQGVYDLTQRERDDGMVESLRRAEDFKELTREGRFNCIVDGLLVQIGASLKAGRRGERDRDESFTFTRMVV